MWPKKKESLKGEKTVRAKAWRQKQWVWGTVSSKVWLEYECGEFDTGQLEGG